MKHDLTPDEIRAELTLEYHLWELFNANTYLDVPDPDEVSIPVCKALESLAACRKMLREIQTLLPGWREVVAEIDDLPKSEVLGKAMWAVLNQMDDKVKALAALLDETGKEA